MTDKNSMEHSKKATASVRMGKIAVGEGTDLLKTILGSCIGVTLYDHANRIGALAHIVLPDSTGHNGPPGKFADTAIPEILRLIVEQGGTIKKLSAKIAGGANMFQTNASAGIGERNIEATEKQITARGIPIVARHCGGDFGRRMTFYLETGNVRIDVVDQETVEI
ncbi:MAG: chemotaxis protein CheD [Pirellulales bacterium]|jgi:chemotaxis protein CheD